MLNLFASIDDLNNMIGEPVNRYRPKYKSMEKLRQIFFSKVGNVPDLEKYLKYYKWVDSALGHMLEQLFPASAKFSPGVRTMIENHLLERPKYEYNFMGNRQQSLPSSDGGNGAQIISTPPLNQVTLKKELGLKGGQPDPSFRVKGKGSNITKEGQIFPFGWKFSHAPLPSSPQKENQNAWWWKSRAERDNSVIAQDDEGVQNSRKAIFAAAQKTYNPVGIATVSAFAPEMSKAEEKMREKIKQVGLAEISFGGLEEEEDIEEEIIPSETKKTKRTFKASMPGPGDMQGSQLLPFTPVSSTVDTGYQKQLQDKGITNVDFANLHHRQESIQTPFTKQHVGGQQARSAPAGAKQSENVRKESFQLDLETGGGSFSQHRRRCLRCGKLYQDL